MRRALRVLQPSSRRELALALALIRPAAQGARGMSKVELAERDDVLVFDDDAAGLLRSVLGCSEEEAEMVRRGIAKGQPVALMELQARLERSNLSSSRVHEVVGAFEHAGKYSFCKSHAMGYAHLCWALAYEKAHRPAAFWREHQRAIGSSSSAHTVYRDWVYRRAAMMVSKHATSVGAVGQQGGGAEAVGCGTVGGMQMRLEGGHVCALRQYRQHGVWAGAAFLPGFFVRSVPSAAVVEGGDVGRAEGQQGGGEGEGRLERIASHGQSADRSDPLVRGDGDEVEFAGLFACGRRYNKDTLFITVGIDNGAFLDLSFRWLAPLLRRPRNGTLDFLIVRYKVSSPCRLG